MDASAILVPVRPARGLHEPLVGRAERAGGAGETRASSRTGAPTSCVDPPPSVAYVYLTPCPLRPDGHQDPFNATVLAYDLIRSLDPLPPPWQWCSTARTTTSGPYTAGADIIMEDVYPIGINSTFSKWGTACNATLGDCGCDNCAGGPHAIRDVADRLDTLARYESMLGLWPKTKVHNPQSFNGEGYWARDPTPSEEFAMNLVALNHGAHAHHLVGLPGQRRPLGPPTASWPKVLTTSPVVDFVIANDRPHALPISGAAAAGVDLDAAYWTSGDGKEILVSLVNAGYGNATQPVQIDLSAAPRVAAVKATLWGNLAWSLSSSNTTRLDGWRAGPWERASCC